MYILSKGLGKEDKMPCPGAQLSQQADLNWGPHG